MMNLLLLQLFNGISLSSVLLLIALGLAVTFGLMNVINMAHGEFIMIGAYMAYLIQSYFQKFLPASAFGWYFVLSLGASFLVAFAVGWLLETVLIRFLYGRPLDSLLATWGVSLVLQQLARQIFGAPNVAVKSPAWLEGALTINADLMLPYKRLFIIALAAVCMLVIYFYLYRTAGGRRLRAVMQNRPMVPASAFPPGVSTPNRSHSAPVSPVLPLRPHPARTHWPDDRHVLHRGCVYGRRAGRNRQAGRDCRRRLGIGVLGTALEYGTSATLVKCLCSR